MIFRSELEAAAELQLDDGRDNHLAAGVDPDPMIQRLDRLDALGIDINFVLGALAALVTDETWDEALTTAAATGGGQRDVAQVRH